MSDEEQQEDLICILCMLPIQHEMFPNGGYLGNNPAPLAPANTRCCDWCNDMKVTPARLGLTGDAAEQMGRTFVRIHAAQRHMMKERMDNDSEVKRLRKELAHYTDNCTIVWMPEDVLSLNDTLTDEQVSWVLERMEHKHDASLGITWDTIEFWIGEVIDNE